MKDMHTQCLLRKGSDNQVSWIPTKFAIEGNYVKLKEENGNWSDGWRVSSIYSTRPSSEVADYERDHRNMRKMTDI